MFFAAQLHVYGDAHIQGDYHNPLCVSVQLSTRIKHDEWQQETLLEVAYDKPDIEQERAEYMANSAQRAHALMQARAFAQGVKAALALMGVHVDLYFNRCD